MTTVTPTWYRFSFDWHDHYARRTDRVLDADEQAYGLRQLVPDIGFGARSAVELKDRTDEQDALDREYREQT